MAKFVYKMQNILDMKYKMEEQAETAFATAANRVREEEEKLAVLIARKEAVEEEYREELGGHIRLNMLNTLQTGIRKLTDDIKLQTVNLKNANKSLDAARFRLEDAIKERKIQEKLREKAFEEFKLELNEQESKEVDELVSYRYGSKISKTGNYKA